MIWLSDRDMSTRLALLATMLATCSQTAIMRSSASPLHAHRHGQESRDSEFRREIMRTLKAPTQANPFHWLRKVFLCLLAKCGKTIKGASATKPNVRWAMVRKIGNLCTVWFVSHKTQDPTMFKLLGRT